MTPVRQPQVAPGAPQPPSRRSRRKEFLTKANAQTIFKLWTSSAESIEITPSSKHGFNLFRRIFLVVNVDKIRPQDNVVEDLALLGLKELWTLLVNLSDEIAFSSGVEFLVNLHSRVHLNSELLNFS